MNFHEAKGLIAPDKQIENGEKAVTYMAETPTGTIELSICLGDITEVDYDAIVCPSNGAFVYVGTGVQKSIAEKAGIEVFKETSDNAWERISGGKEPVRSFQNGMIELPAGSVNATTAGRLARIKRIIHVNNLRVESGLPFCDEEVVRLAVRNCLDLADKEGLSSIAFPALGSGGLGMTLADSMRGTVMGMYDYFTGININSKVHQIGFVVYADPTIQNANEMNRILFQDVFPGIR